jgi:ferredoxin-thioredoxin reductase catalytic subunit
MRTKIIENPDEEIVKEARQRLDENDGYCPCALLKNEDTKCMCLDFRQNVKEGWCNCGLYIKVKVGKDNGKT